MLSVAAAFIYKERDAKNFSKINQLVKSEEKSNASDIHCW